MRILFILASSFALSGCGKNVLHYHLRPHYSEENTFQRKDGGTHLLQNVAFNKKYVVDEEFWYTLEFTFIDTLAAQTKKQLDLVHDKTIVQVTYGFGSVWHWDKEVCVISGTITIKSWKNNAITLKENVYVKDLSNKTTKIFKGQRSFHLKKKE